MTAGNFQSSSQLGLGLLVERPAGFEKYVTK